MANRLALAALAIITLLIGAWWQRNTLLCEDALIRRRASIERFENDRRTLEDVPRYCQHLGFF